MGRLKSWWQDRIALMGEDGYKAGFYRIQGWSYRAAGLAAMVPAAAQFHDLVVPPILTALSTPIVSSASAAQVDWYASGATAVSLLGLSDSPIPLTFFIPVAVAGLLRGGKLHARACEYRDRSVEHARELAESAVSEESRQKKGRAPRAAQTSLASSRTGTEPTTQGR